MSADSASSASLLRWSIPNALTKRLATAAGKRRLAGGPTPSFLEAFGTTSGSAYIAGSTRKNGFDFNCSLSLSSKNAVTDPSSVKPMWDNGSGEDVTEIGGGRCVGYSASDFSYFEKFLHVITLPMDIRRVPYSKPPFTVGEIKKAIPPHCFRRSVLHSALHSSFSLAEE